ncbi:small proline-rich protein 2F-like [Ranitomeya imitator]|uniref:small proline-rich protein 2F-like n=1 Tax=Ranitomeya imitator TaxID=111125 RepID=UPI001AA3BACE
MSGVKGQQKKCCPEPCPPPQQQCRDPCKPVCPEPICPPPQVCVPVPVYPEPKCPPPQVCVPVCPEPKCPPPQVQCKPVQQCQQDKTCVKK